MNWLLLIIAIVFLLLDYDALYWTFCGASCLWSVVRIAVAMIEIRRLKVEIRTLDSENARLFREICASHLWVRQWPH